MVEPTTDLHAEVLLRETAWLRRLAATLVVDGARADDLVQQTLLAALERPPARVANPRAWLGRVAGNLARRIGLAERRRTARERTTAQGESLPPTDEVVARTELLHETVGAVLALAEPYRTCLLLRFHEDLKPAAIARRAGVPVETVRTRLKRGLELLRTELVTRRGRAHAGSEGLVGLLVLLDPALRRAVRRLVLTKGPAATSAAIGGFGVAGLLGVIGMSTKLKLAVAAVVLASGAFTIVKLCESPRLPRHDLAATPMQGVPELPAPATVDAKSAPPAASASRSLDREPDPEAATRPTPSSLVATGVVVGTVRDVDGAPVADAVVGLEYVDQGGQRFGSALMWWCTRIDQLLAPIDATAPARRGALRRTKTSVSGTFRFDGLETAGQVDVIAVERGKGVGLVTAIALAVPGPDVTVDVSLRAGVVLHGRVEDEARRGVRGARIDISAWEGVGGQQISTPIERVRADDDGTYRSLPLPFQRFSFQCGADGFADASEDLPSSIADGEHEVRQDFTLKAVATVAGRIVLLDGTSAHLDRLSEDLVVIGGTVDPRTGAMGPCHLGERGTLDRAAGRYELSCRRGRARFVSLWSGIALLGAVRVAESGSGPDLPIDPTQVPPPPRSGALTIEVVLAGTGAPVTDATITLDWDLPAMLGFGGVLPEAVRARQAETRFRKGFAREGRVEFADLEVGSYDVVVRADGFAPRVLSLAVAEGRRDAPRIIELAKPRGEVIGRVVDEAGRGVALASVLLIDASGVPAFPDSEADATTDAKGDFRFPSVADGEWFVVASSEQLAPAAVAVKVAGDSVRPVLPVPIVLRDGVDVTISPRRKGGALRGERISTTCMIRVRDERGVPVVDDHRLGRRVLHCGESFPLRLAAGSYTVELLTPFGASDPVRFTATPDAIVEVGLATAGE